MERLVAESRIGETGALANRKPKIQRSKRPLISHFPERRKENALLRHVDWDFIHTLPFWRGWLFIQYLYNFYLCA